MQSTVEELDGNKVKLRVTVSADEFERAIDGAFKKLAREVRVPGFRPGKAPRQLLEARFGPDAAREQALRDALPEYYVEAVEANDVDVIAPPEIEITAGQEEGDVEFDAVVEVRPQVRLLGYDELKIELPFEPVPVVPPLWAVPPPLLVPPPLESPPRSEACSAALIASPMSE